MANIIVLKNLEQYNNVYFNEFGKWLGIITNSYCRWDTSVNNFLKNLEEISIVSEFKQCNH